MDEIFSPTNWHDLYYDADYEKARDRFIPKHSKPHAKAEGIITPLKMKREGRSGRQVGTVVSIWL